MKKFNIKAFFVNHVEKIFFGIIMLVVLLSLMKTTWSSGVRSRDELLGEVSKVKDRIESPDNIWTDRDQFKVVDFSEKAKQLLTQIPSDEYLFSTPLFFPLVKVDEPRREPNYEAVQMLTAKAALVAINVKVEPTLTLDTLAEKEKEKAKEKEQASKVSDEFASRTNPSGAANTDNRFNKGIGTLFAEKDRDRQPDVARELMRDSATSGPVATSKALAAGSAARGYRVVAVRGVFPLKQQLDDFQKALHITPEEAYQVFEIADFVLERQVAGEGAEPWKNSEWKPVSIEYALEVLQEASVQDPDDPVPFSMKDPVITMELPWKLIGFWEDLATHEKIKDQLLKQDELEEQNKILETLDDTAREAKLNDAPKQRRRGLAPVQADYKNLAQQIRGRNDINEQVNKRLNSVNRRRMEPNAPGGGRFLDSVVSDRKQYLLFRYLDFDVQSGLAYRYRVRLALRNPNFEVAPEKLGGADPNIANGAERQTPWSNISNVAVVPHTIEYFLENVGRDPYREEKLRTTEAFPVAMMSMYNFDTKYGTWTSTNSLKILALGSFVGDDKVEEEKPRKASDKKKDDKKDERRDEEKKENKKGAEKKNEHKILDLTLGGIVTKKYFFTSLDTLVDVEPDAEIEPDQHLELTFLKEKRPDRSAAIGLTEGALVATALGELKTLDPISQVAEKDRLAQRVRGERAPYKEVEIKKPEPAMGNPRMRQFRQRNRRR